MSKVHMTIIERNYSRLDNSMTFVKDKAMTMDQRNQMDSILSSAKFSGKNEYQIRPSFSYGEIEMGSRNHVTAAVDRADGKVVGFDHIILDNAWVDSVQIPYVKRTCTVVRKDRQKQGVGSAVASESLKDTEMVFTQDDTNKYGISASFANANDAKTIAFYESMKMQKLASFALFTSHIKSMETDRRVVAVCKGDIDVQNQVLEILKNEYVNYQLIDGSFCNLKEAESIYQRPESGNYFIIYKNGEIVAGAKFVKERDLKVSGQSPSFLEKIGLASKNEPRSVNFDHLFAKQGHEKDLWVLLRTVAGRYNPNINKIQVIADVRDENIRRYFSMADATSTPKGLGGNGSFENPAIHLFAKTYGVSEKVVETIKEGPVLFPSDVAFYQ